MCDDLFLSVCEFMVDWMANGCFHGFDLLYYVSFIHISYDVHILDL